MGNSTSRIIFRNTWTAEIQNPEKIESYACLCSTTFIAQRKAIEKLVCTMPKKWQQLRANSSQGIHWCFLELASEKTWWNGNPNKPYGQWDSQVSQMVDMFKCHTSHTPYSLGQLTKGGRNWHFQGAFENKKILINTIWAGDLLCIYNCMYPWYDTEKLALTPRGSEEDEQIDLDPEQLTSITQKQQTVRQARGDSLPQLKENHETLIWRASE